MALERKDLRVYLDADTHGALVVLAELEDLEPAKLAERLVSDWVRNEVRRATLIASKADVQGFSGITPEELVRARRWS